MTHLAPLLPADVWHRWTRTSRKLLLKLEPRLRTTVAAILDLTATFASAKVRKNDFIALRSFSVRLPTHREELLRLSFSLTVIRSEINCLHRDIGMTTAITGVCNYMYLFLIFDRFSITGSFGKKKRNIVQIHYDQTEHIQLLSLAILCPIFVSFKLYFVQASFSISLQFRHPKSMVYD